MLCASTALAPKVLGSGASEVARVSLIIGKKRSAYTMKVLYLNVFQRQICHTPFEKRKASAGD